MTDTKNEPTQHRRAGETRNMNLTTQQKAVLIYRKARGYELSECTYMGRKYPCAINYDTGHIMVVNSAGYDIHVRDFAPVTSRELTDNEIQL